MSVLHLLATSNFIVVNKKIIKQVGLQEAIVLGELCSQYSYAKSINALVDNEWFYCTMEKLEENTTLSRHQQDKALNRLKLLGIIEIKLKGVPPKRHFKVKEETIIPYLFENVDNLSFVDNSVKNVDNLEKNVDNNSNLSKINNLNCQFLATNNKIYNNKLNKYNNITNSNNITNNSNSYNIEYTSNIESNDNLNERQVELIKNINVKKRIPK